MRRWSLWCLAGAMISFLPACGGAESNTRKQMSDWGQALKFHITTAHDSNYEFPHELSGVDPDLRAGLSDVDAWGYELYYRRWRDDRYDLISSGPNGELGDDDDIVSVNGKFTEPAKVYAERPLED